MINLDSFWKRWFNIQKLTKIIQGICRIKDTSQDLLNKCRKDSVKNSIPSSVQHIETEKTTQGISRIKDNNHMTFSTNSEKGSDKTALLRNNKALKTLRTRG